MASPSSIAKQLRYKKEVTFKTPPGASGAQLLRRVESSLDIDKDTYASNEKRSDYQDSDFRHGMRKSSGNIKGELSPKTYAELIGAALRRDFAAVTPTTGASITVALGSLVNDIQQYTVTRAAGSFLTDGIKAGDVVRLSAGSFNAANLAKNLYVISLTATVLTVVPLNGVALVAEGPIATSTVTVQGKKTYVPATGHTDQSFCFEHWFADASPTMSEVYPGMKVSNIDLSLPPTGMATIDISLVGPGSVINSSAVYYTSPAALTATGNTAAVNGVLYVGGAAVGICTGLNFKLEGGHGGDPVVGSNTMPTIFPGKVKVSGNLTAYFDNGTFRDAFLDETELALSMVLSSDNSANSDFMAFTLPRIKLNSGKKNETERGVMISADFKGLVNNAGGTGTSSEQTTISVQDSAA
jgi:hypothetical protein